MDALGFRIETPTVTEPHDLTTPRGRLLYLRDVVVPGIPGDEMVDMMRLESSLPIRCGTAACLWGWGFRDENLREHLGRNAWLGDEGLAAFGISHDQFCHLFLPNPYGQMHPSKAELTQHINDVLDGRVK